MKRYIKPETTSVEIHHADTIMATSGPSLQLNTTVDDGDIVSDGNDVLSRENIWSTEW